MARKRSHGEGSVRKLKSGNWHGEVMDGYSADGKKRIISFSAATKAEVLDKIRDYQNKKDANSKAKIEWEQQQKSAKLGLVSAVELQALELQYEQTEMELSAAAYAYDLAWEEYNMLMNGTTLDIYDVYKSKLS